MPCVSLPLIFDIESMGISVRSYIGRNLSYSTWQWRCVRSCRSYGVVMTGEWEVECSKEIRQRHWAGEAYCRGTRCQLL